MSTILICDDENEDLRLIQEMLTKQLLTKEKSFEVIMCMSADELLANPKVGMADYCFLDIELGGMNGVEAAFELYKRNPWIKVIFVSHHEGMVFEAIHARPVRFVRKSKLAQDLSEAIAYIILEKERQNSKILFQNGNKKVELPVKSILYVANNGHYIDIITHKKNFKVRGKVSDYAGVLGDNSFLQIQKGIWVNLEYVDSLKRGCLYLKNNESFNISRVLLDDVKRRVMEYLRSEVM